MSRDIFASSSLAISQCSICASYRVGEFPAIYMVKLYGIFYSVKKCNKVQLSTPSNFWASMYFQLLVLTYQCIKLIPPSVSLPQFGSFTKGVRYIYLQTELVSVLNS